MRALALIPLVALLGCDDDAVASAEVARALIAEHGCHTCHRIPGTPGADGRTGPPLDAMARQVYVAGVLANTPENLAKFIADPQEVDPRSAMPDLGVSPEQALAIAQYLYAVGEGA